MTPPAPARTSALWRLEWWRLVRTGRWLAVAAGFLLFGVLGPVGARYVGELLSGASQSGSIEVIAKPPVPADGITGYTSNAGQIGLIVSVVVVAAALSLQGKPGLATFYRTRLHRSADLVVPRLAVVAGAVAVAYTLGMLLAVAGTVLLIGSPPAGAVAAAWLCQLAYLLFALTVTALAATLARGTLGTIGWTLAGLFALPLLGLLPWLDRRLPSALAGNAPALLAGAPLSDYAVALGLAAALGAAAVVVAVLRAGRREL